MKKHPKRPKWLLVIYITASIGIMLLLANTILSAVLTSKAKQAFKTFPPALQISVSSIHANLFTSSLSIKDFTAYYTPYGTLTLNKHTIYLKNISLSGINLFKLIFNKKISANNLIIDGGNVQLDQFLLDKKDSAQSLTLPKMQVANINISRFTLNSTDVWLQNLQRQHLLLHAVINLGGIKIQDVNKPTTPGNIEYASIEAILSNIQYTMPGTRQTLQIKSLALNSKTGNLQIDSIQVNSHNGIASVDSLNKQQLLSTDASIAGITIQKTDFLQLAKHNFIAQKIIVNSPNISITGSNTQLISFLQQYLPSNRFAINIDSLKISNASVQYQGSTKSDGNKTNLQRPPTLPFTTAVVNHLAITNANLSLRFNKTDAIKTKGDITVDHITLDSLHKHFDAIACNLTTIECNMPGTYNKLQVQRFVADSKKSICMADGIKIIPLHDKLALGRMLGHQADYIDASIAGIELVKPDILQLLDKKLVADKIIVNEVKAYVFRDRRLQRLLQPQPLPVTSLKNIPFDIQVKTLQVNHSSVAYEEFPKDGVQTGTLKIEKFQLSISPLINHTHNSTASHLAVHVYGAIMGSGSITADISMPLNTNEDYTAKGVINNLDLTTLNSSAENLGKFHIESGMLDKLDFQFNFNDVKSTGSIVGVYHNLVVDKLKGNDKKIAWLPTLVVKNVIIRKNKDASLPVNRRTGKIDYTRDPTRFSSFYLLKSLLTGIRSSFTFGFLLPK